MPANSSIACISGILMDCFKNVRCNWWIMEMLQVIVLEGNLIKLEIVIAGTICGWNVMDRSHWSWQSIEFGMWWGVLKVLNVDNLK